MIAPVRLDKWQNIVNVGWPDGENQPPPGDLDSPQLWDFTQKRNDNDVTSLEMHPWEGVGGGFFEDAIEGDLLLAHMSCDRALDHGDPWPKITISPPGAGDWQELWQFSTEQGGTPDSPGFDQTGSLWYKWVQAAEVGADISYTWTYSQTCPVIGTVYRVIKPFPEASPFPDGGPELDIKEQTTGIATGPDFSISRNKALIMAFIDVNSNGNTSIIFPSNPSGSGSYTRRTFFRAFGTANGHAQIAYDAEDEPGPGAIGARSLSISTGLNTILGHFAVIGNPVP